MIVALKYSVIAFALACASSHAMTADELVARNLDARGGLARLEAIKTLRSEGKLLLGGQFELGFTQLQSAPDSLRTEAGLQGLTAVQAWNGIEAWQISPFQGRKDPEKMSSDDARALAGDAPIGGPLVGWKARGSRIEYLGTEDVDGTDAHKLKITLKNGDVFYDYLDPDHFLEIRAVAQRSVRGTQVESVSDFGEYEEVAGVYFPFSIATENKADGSRQQLTIDHAEVNVPMDESLFAFPVAAKPAAAKEAGK